VVVDSDELVRHRKGPHRPIVPEDERIEMIHHLRWCDIITVRPLSSHTEDSEYLNKAVKPDVCILSTSTGDIPEEKRKHIEQYVGRVALFPPQAETSSSARIRRLAIDGASPLAAAMTNLVSGKAEEIALILNALPRELKVLIDAHLEELNRS
jgi:D-beta-D-heptose 7-phosphate kinase/D-beta-D-heptose 1-phosphate adenosyltransferase